MSKPFYVGGSWSTSSEKLDVIFPFDGSVVEAISLAQPSDIDIALKKAQEAKDDTASLEPYERSQILRFIADEMEKEHEAFSTLLTLENGKTIRESRIEISRTIGTFRIAAGEAERIYGESYDLAVNPLASKRHAIVKKFPVGVVAGIAPFNFPMNLAAHKIAPAIATGCPIVVKPASSTPLTLLKLAEIVEKSNWPKGAFSVLPCSRSVGQQLVEDDRIALLSFTGSPFVGWKMKAQAGKKKVVLELGGNAAVIVDKDVKDWDWVIERCVIGAFFQAGQVCISVQRIYVHEDVMDVFREKFFEKVRSLRVGDPRDESTDMGGMIDEKNVSRISDWVDEALDAGASCDLGHRYEGSVYQPTILSDVSKDMKVQKEEGFGPYVNLYPFFDIGEAIDAVNDSDFGLQAGVFTHDHDTIWKAFHRLEVGGVVHNDIPSFRADMMPYGGVKDSGLGREGLKYAMEDMLEERVLVLRNGV